jgi:hypothetical protein
MRNTTCWNDASHKTGTNQLSGIESIVLDREFKVLGIYFITWHHSRLVSRASYDTFQRLGGTMLATKLKLAPVKLRLSYSESTL